MFQEAPPQLGVAADAAHFPSPRCRQRWTDMSVKAMVVPALIALVLTGAPGALSPDGPQPRPRTALH